MVILTPRQDDLYFSMAILQRLRAVRMGEAWGQMHRIGRRRLKPTGRATCIKTNLNLAVYQVPYSG